MWELRVFVSRGCEGSRKDRKYHSLEFLPYKMHIIGKLHLSAQEHPHHPL